MMIYVVILIAVGTAGILKLWTAQRRASARLYSIDAHESLKRLSKRPTPGTVTSGYGDKLSGSKRTAGLSAEGRAAAKRRIEARRESDRLGDRGRKTSARAS